MAVVAGVVEMGDVSKFLSFKQFQIITKPSLYLAPIIILFIPNYNKDFAIFLIMYTSLQVVLFIYEDAYLIII